jgi:hypothetical protein
MSGVRTSQSDASRNMDLARAPRRTARKKGSGYENVPVPCVPGPREDASGPGDEDGRDLEVQNNIQNNITNI